ncbi:hypothetical protein M0R04_09490 [Candidatus Dojkabacteria bacterium]|jgi:hypothetical protein|nr:hypothetical protein [Candidatus Dojkabacteria bacterium]
MIQPAILGNLMRNASAPAYTYYDIGFGGGTVNRNFSGLSFRETGFPTNSAGSLMLYLSFLSTEGLTLTPPSGWTTISVPTPSGFSFVASYKISSGSEPASATWSWGTSCSGNIQLVSFTKAGGTWVEPGTIDFISSSSEVKGETSGEHTYSTASIDIPDKSILLSTFFFGPAAETLTTAPIGMTTTLNSIYNGGTWGANSTWYKIYSATASDVVTSLVCEGSAAVTVDKKQWIIAARD